MSCPSFRRVRRSSKCSSATVFVFPLVGGLWAAFFTLAFCRMGLDLNKSDAE